MDVKRMNEILADFAPEKVNYSYVLVGTSSKNF